MDEDLRPEDRRWLDAARERFRPEPMSSARKAAFLRELEGRIARPARARRFALPALAAGAFAAALLWLALPRDPGDDVEVPVPTLQAFVDPDAGEPEDYLPADYLVLASLLADEADDL